MINKCEECGRPHGITIVYHNDEYDYDKVLCLNCAYQAIDQIPKAQYDAIDDIHYQVFFGALDSMYGPNDLEDNELMDMLCKYNDSLDDAQTQLLLDVIDHRMINIVGVVDYSMYLHMVDIEELI